MPEEWLVFFGKPSHTLLPVFSIRKLWSMIMHLIRCQECSGSIPWPGQFRGNPLPLPDVQAAYPRLAPAPPPRVRRRYRHRVWGLRAWRRRRLDRAAGVRRGRLSRVREDLAGYGAGHVERENTNQNTERDDWVIGNGLGE